MFGRFTSSSLSSLCTCGQSHETVSLSRRGLLTGAGAVATTLTGARTSGVLAQAASRLASRAVAKARRNIEFSVSKGRTTGRGRLGEGEA